MAQTTGAGGADDGNDVTADLRRLLAELRDLTAALGDEVTAERARHLDRVLAEVEDLRESEQSKAVPHDEPQPGSPQPRPAGSIPA